MARVRIQTFSCLLIVAAGLVLARIITSPKNSTTENSLKKPTLNSSLFYHSDEHAVSTEDGYLLTIFRFRKNCSQFQKTPVVLAHGLLQSSDAWLDAGPGAGLAYLLADACQDVWLVNNRGNYYSKAHKTLDPKDEKFWQFSVDEMGNYDLPAIIDYVTNHTGVEKVNYIGYSQGSGSFYIMCSERPGYCDKVQALVSLAPAARQFNTKSKTYRMLTQTVNRISGVLYKSGVQEVFSKGQMSQSLLLYLCEFFSNLCPSFLTVIDEFHPGSISRKTSLEMYRHFPAGTSVQNIARYGQAMTTDDFVKFDHGKETNLELYGTTYPPSYNLSAVTVPTLVMFGLGDRLVDPKDVKWLAHRLPMVVTLLPVQDAQWTHMDMVYSKSTSELVFKNVHTFLSKFQ